MNLQPFYRNSKTSRPEEISGITYKPSQTYDIKNVVHLLIIFEKCYQKSRLRVMKHSLIQLQKIFHKYLCYQISVVKMQRLFIDKTNENKLAFLEQLCFLVNKPFMANTPKKTTGDAAQSTRQISAGMEAINLYLQDGIPSSRLNKAEINKIFSAKQLCDMLNTLILKKRAQLDAFALLKQLYFLGMHEVTNSLDTSIALVKNFESKTFDLAQDRLESVCNGVKKLSDLVFKNKESAFYCVKSRVGIADRLSDSPREKAPWRESCKARLSKFFDSRRSRKFKSLEQERNRAENSMDPLDDHSSEQPSGADTLNFSVRPNGIRPTTFPRENDRNSSAPHNNSFKAKELSLVSRNTEEMTERQITRQEKFNRLSKIMLGQEPVFQEKHIEKYMRYEHSCYQILRIFKGALKRELYYSFDNLKNWRTYDLAAQRLLIKVFHRWNEQTTRMAFKYLMRWRDNSRKKKVALNSFRNFLYLLASKRKLLLKKAFLKVQFAAASTSIQQSYTNSSLMRDFSRGYPKENNAKIQQGVAKIRKLIAAVAYKSSWEKITQHYLRELPQKKINGKNILPRGTQITSNLRVEPKRDAEKLSDYLASASDAEDKFQIATTTTTEKGVVIRNTQLRGQDFKEGSSNNRQATRLDSNINQLKGKFIGRDLTEEKTCVPSDQQQKSRSRGDAKEQLKKALDFNGLTVKNDLELGECDSDQTNAELDFINYENSILRDQIQRKSQGKSSVVSSPALESRRSSQSDVRATSALIRKLFDLNRGFMLWAFNTLKMAPPSRKEMRILTLNVKGIEMDHIAVEKTPVFSGLPEDHINQNSKTEPLNLGSARENQQESPRIHIESNEVSSQVFQEQLKPQPHENEGNQTLNRPHTINLTQLSAPQESKMNHEPANLQNQQNIHSLQGIQRSQHGIRESYEDITEKLQDPRENVQLSITDINKHSTNGEQILTERIKGQSLDHLNASDAVAAKDKSLENCYDNCETSRNSKLYLYEQIRKKPKGPSRSLEPHTTNRQRQNSEICLEKTKSPNNSYIPNPRDQRYQENINSDVCHYSQNQLLKQHHPLTNVNIQTDSLENYQAQMHFSKNPKDGPRTQENFTLQSQPEQSSSIENFREQVQPLINRQEVLLKEQQRLNSEGNENVQFRRSDHHQQHPSPQNLLGNHDSVRDTKQILDGPYTQQDSGRNTEKRTGVYQYHHNQPPQISNSIMQSARAETEPDRFFEREPYHSQGPNPYHQNLRLQRNIELEILKQHLSSKQYPGMQDTGGSTEHLSASCQDVNTGPLQKLRPQNGFSERSQRQVEAPKEFVEQNGVVQHNKPPYAQHQNSGREMWPNAQGHSRVEHVEILSDRGKPQVGVESSLRGQSFYQCQSAERDLQSKALTSPLRDKILPEIPTPKSTLQLENNKALLLRSKRFSGSLKNLNTFVASKSSTKEVISTTGDTEDCRTLESCQDVHSQQRVFSEETFSMAGNNLLYESPKFQIEVLSNQNKQNQSPIGNGSCFQTSTNQTQFSKTNQGQIHIPWKSNEQGHIRSFSEKIRSSESNSHYKNSLKDMQDGAHEKRASNKTDPPVKIWNERFNIPESEKNENQIEKHQDQRKKNYEEQLRVEENFEDRRYQKSGSSSRRLRTPEINENMIKIAENYPEDPPHLQESIQQLRGHLISPQDRNRQTQSFEKYPIKEYQLGNGNIRGTISESERLYSHGSTAQGYATLATENDHPSNFQFERSRTKSYQDLLGSYSVGKTMTVPDNRMLYREAREPSYLKNNMKDYPTIQLFQSEDCAVSFRQESDINIPFAEQTEVISEKYELGHGNTSGNISKPESHSIATLQQLIAHSEIPKKSEDSPTSRSRFTHHIKSASVASASYKSLFPNERDSTQNAKLLDLSRVPSWYNYSKFLDSNQPVEGSTRTPRSPILRLKHLDEKIQKYKQPSIGTHQQKQDESSPRRDLYQYKITEEDLLSQEGDITQRPQLSQKPILKLNLAFVNNNMSAKQRTKTELGETPSAVFTPMDTEKTPSEQFWSTTTRKRDTTKNKFIPNSNESEGGGSPGILTSKNYTPIESPLNSRFALNQQGSIKVTDLFATNKSPSHRKQLSLVLNSQEKTPKQHRSQLSLLSPKEIMASKLNINPFSENTSNKSNNQPVGSNSYRDPITSKFTGRSTTTIRFQ